MSTKLNEPKTFLLDKRRSRIRCFAGLHAQSVSSLKHIRSSIAQASKDSLWISFEQALTNALLKSIEWPTPRLGVALLLHRPELETLAALGDCFREVVFSTNDGFLPPEELGEVLAADHKRDLFIGGTADKVSETITLWRGDMSSLTVPLDAFEPSGKGTAPDFDAFSIADYGHTIRFGEYEAATDAVLYEFDPEYRRRKAQQRRASERSFGASLRRLRKQRQLRREDFPPLSPKTIARIEQGKVARVHPRTLTTLAKRLKVSPDEIKDF